MKWIQLTVGLFFVSGVLGGDHAGAADQKPKEIKVVCSESDRTEVPIGKTLTFTASGDLNDGEKRIYRVMLDFHTTVDQGEMVFEAGKATASFTVKESGNYMFVFDPTGEGFDIFCSKSIQLGWASGLEALKPSLPRPDDFDGFWSKVKKEVEEVPFEPLLTLVKTESDGVEVYLFEANAGGSKIYTSDAVKAVGYFAKPKGKGPFPAMMTLYGAGELKADMNNAIQNARRGALALAISPHPLPTDQPDDFYQKLRQKELVDYMHIGNDSREKSYFLGMFKRCYQASRFLDTHPLWNKKQFVVHGFSQGGAQSIATAYLNPHVTALAVICPAMCDLTGYRVGRRSAWPFWVKEVPTNYALRLSEDPLLEIKNREEEEAARYFDAVNFSAGLKATALVAQGQIDWVGLPCVAFNQMAGEKKLYIMPDTGHAGDSGWNATEETFLKEQLHDLVKR